MDHRIQNDLHKQNWMLLSTTQLDVHQKVPSQGATQFKGFRYIL